MFSPGKTYSYNCAQKAKEVGNQLKSISLSLSLSLPTEVHTLLNVQGQRQAKNPIQTSQPTWYQKRASPPPAVQTQNQQSKATKHPRIFRIGQGEGEAQIQPRYANA